MSDKPLHSHSIPNVTTTAFGPIEQLNLNEVEAKIRAAHKEVNALCNGKRWTMCIPARPNEDSDLIIADALRDAEKAVAQLQVFYLMLAANRAGEQAIIGSLPAELIWEGLCKLKS